MQVRDGGVKSNLWFLLLKLAERGALDEAIFTSTTTLARDLGCSQQTVSRWLKDLSGEGYIERVIDARGERIELTKKGVRELTKVHSTLGALLRVERRRFVSVEGRLFSGFGEGAYYVSKEGYMKQFISKLGFKPFPGTLNLRLSRLANMVSRRKLEESPGISIEGFSNGARTYGPLKCFHALVEGRIKGALALVQRTHYDSGVVEVISPVYLRDVLKLSDNDLVRLKVFL